MPSPFFSFLGVGRAGGGGVKELGVGGGGVLPRRRTSYHPSEVIMGIWMRFIARGVGGGG